MSLWQKCNLIEHSNNVFHLVSKIFFFSSSVLSPSHSVLNVFCSFLVIFKRSAISSVNARSLKHFHPANDTIRNASFQYESRILLLLKSFLFSFRASDGRFSYHSEICLYIKFRANYTTIIAQGPRTICLTS